MSSVSLRKPYQQILIFNRGENSIRLLNVNYSGLFLQAGVFFYIYSSAKKDEGINY